MLKCLQGSSSTIRGQPGWPRLESDSMSPAPQLLFLKTDRTGPLDLGTLIGCAAAPAGKADTFQIALALVALVSSVQDPITSF